MKKNILTILIIVFFVGCSAKHTDKEITTVRAREALNILFTNKKPNSITKSVVNLDIETIKNRLITLFTIKGVWVLEEKRDEELFFTVPISKLKELYYDSSNKKEKQRYKLLIDYGWKRVIKFTMYQNPNGSWRIYTDYYFLNREQNKLYFNLKKDNEEVYKLCTNLDVYLTKPYWNLILKETVNLRKQ